MLLRCAGSESRRSALDACLLPGAMLSSSTSWLMRPATVTARIHLCNASLLYRSDAVLILTSTAVTDRLFADLMYRKPACVWKVFAR